MENNKKNSLPHIHRRYLIIISFVFMLIVGAFIIYIEYNHYQKSVDAIRSEVVKDKKANLKNLVDRAVETVELIKRSVDKDIYGDLKKRVDDAYNIALNLYVTNKGKISDKRIKEIIRESLRTYRFNNGRGYYYIIDTKGGNYLHPINTKIENTNTLNIKSPNGEYPIRNIVNLLKRQDRGFVTYDWELPGNGEARTHKKMAYVRKLPFFNFIIGTGEYIDYVEKELQAKALKKIRSMRYDVYGYIFVTQFDGNALIVESSKYSDGDNLKDVTDAYGRNVFELELENAQKPDGGYFDYSWYIPEYDEYRDKIGYVRGVLDWKWIVGGFADTTEMEAYVNSAQDELKANLKNMVLIIIFILIILMFVIHVFSKKMEKMIIGIFESYFMELKNALSRRDVIDIDKYKYYEYKNLAKATNTVLRVSNKAFDLVKDSETKLKELNVTKDRFFSIIAHDLKNPFNSILGFVNILNDEYEELGEEEKKQYIEIIKNNSDNFYKLILNLLDWSRLQTSGISFLPKQTNILDMVENTIDPIRELAVSKGIKIKIIVPPAITAMIDENMISTVVRNVTTNAIKFTNTGGIIEIRGSIEGANLKLCVKDNGVGIPKEVQKKLFKISEKVSTKGTANETGTGIGLILCKEFVDKHNGEIYVESEEEQGSEFCILLPIK